MTQTNNQAKDKAEELINKFMPHAYPFSAGSGYLTGDIDKESQRRYATQIAVICVEEILEDILGLEQYDFEPRNKFWTKVKNELLKL